MRTLTVLTIIVGLFFCKEALAQEYVRLYGSVFDKESNTTLPGASLFSTQFEIGVTTDGNGRFELLIPKEDISITVSFIGYQSKVIRFTQSELSPIDEIEELVKLDPLIEELPIATVEGEIRTTVFEDPIEAVLDFEFLGDDLLVLISSRKLYRIQLYDENLNRTSALILNDKPIGLYKDCFNGVHVLFRTRIDELEKIGKALAVKMSHSIVDYRTILKPCIASTPNYVFFSNTDLQNQRVTYFSRSRADGESRQIYVVTQKDQLDRIEHNQRIVKLLQDRLSNESFATQSDRLEVERDIEQHVWFEHVVLTKATYHPLFVLNDTLVVFDHFNSEVNLLDEEGNTVQSTEIDYHFNKSWKEQIHMDDALGKFYVEFEDSGISTLHEFVPGSGSLQKVLSISDHTFPEKLEVRKGKAWYIHQDFDQRSPALYRLDLVQ